MASSLAEPTWRRAA